MLEHADITEAIIGSAIEVHRGLGPGLLESAYEICLSHELTQRGVPFRRQAPVPLAYKGATMPEAYRADLIVADSVLVELKSVDRVLPIHEAQLLTYLKLAGLKVGLLINFNVPRLTDGIVRRVL